MLVPAFAESLADPHVDPTMLADLAGLVALVPEPDAADAAAQPVWKAMLAALGHASEKVQRAFSTRRAAAAHERATPPPMIKKVNFCNAASATPFPKLEQ